MALRLLAVQKSFTRAVVAAGYNSGVRRSGWAAAASASASASSPMATRGFAAEAAPTPSASDATPTVMDKLISLTVVDPSGARRKINGMVGTTLYEACETNEVELGPATFGGPPVNVHSERWTEPVFGEGPTSGYDHVVLSNTGGATMPPMTRPESRMLEDYWDFDELFPESRLASQIHLTKEMDGMIVYVPDRVDDSNP
mmetsp:Transcript_29278/g.70546  ORF Transcript_29278/g.70546 Transcript_29278/m.70546 type:complete len:200 (+) Transcript_29278:81-680(+)|eukprot:CAMPEP_0113453062 /NCGR_PEP_ID=MMETSP0014_2-20120614/7166_1 /TAXON_ID=2857 /ORGANISM="Nitzschia sp." /LENGTH=199 /DNA_ID=CAMNT_0000344449 /DNA_START=76 /DNA_END=675 /DNA_ORIENTATION=- /assembly_acc=CAM_ASM_000159